MKLKELNKTKDVADETGIPEQTWRISRLTGLLHGRPAPKHIKMGRSVFYRKKDIEDWLDSLYEDDSSSKSGG